MPNYADIDEVLSLLEKSQDAERDQRDEARDAHMFVDKKDGQWEQGWWDRSADKPRYQFDMTEPIVDQISGEMERANFDINIKPAGGDSTKDDAQLLDGLIRNIENISGASHIYNDAARNMVTAGIDGWRVVTEFVDDNTFDQDLVIKPLYNFIDRVWFDTESKDKTRADSRYGFALSAKGVAAYKEKYPKGSGMSVSEGRQNSHYWNTKDDIILGQIYYIKETERELLLMSDNRILENDEEFEKIEDELIQRGITIQDRRMRKKKTCFARIFDGQMWLNEEQETPFSFVPLIPTYGNYKISENTTLYRGIVQKMMDPQRVYNYSLSREIEEGALAPRAKYWMTRKQAQGNEAEISTLNTNSDPVQFYNPDPEAPGPPQQSGGAQINPGLRTISETMRNQMNMSAGMFAANMGDNPNAQSGVAIERLQNKGDNGTVKFFSSQEVAICHTARVLMSAIPRVYDSRRMVRIMGADGAFSMEQINDEVTDQETGDRVIVNDMSKGVYDVTCSSGPSFQNKQQETVAAIVEVAKVDPTIIQTGSDILLGNIDAPGMGALAERSRSQLLQAGIIPQSQWTDEEEQLMQAQQQQQAQQNQQPDAMTIAALAEEKKAQADLITAQNKQAETQIGVQVKSAQIQLEGRKQQLNEAEFMHDSNVDRAKLGQSGAQLAQSQQSNQFDQMMELMKANMMQTTAAITDLNTQVKSLVGLRDAIGADTIVGPTNTAAYKIQADEVLEAQDET